MDENVALDSAKQKDFVKSVRGIKKLLKKKDKKPKDAEAAQEKVEIRKEEKVKIRRNRGLVYLSHIPHGFYEQQMTEYFKQFGVVTNARVIRSRRTGNSKGFAFVEFKEPAVAQIVAETMNNYLMGKRLIKAAYIPPHKQKIHAMRKKWNTQNNPATDERLKFKKMHNADKNDNEELKIARKLLSNLSKTKRKLRDLGIDYDFFKPVDVPEALKEKIEDTVSQKDIKPNKQVKNESKEPKLEEAGKEIKSEPEDAINIGVKTEKKKKKQPKQKQIDCKVISESNDSLKKNKTVSIKSDKQKPKENMNRNKIIKKKLEKDKIIKGPVNFISIKESDNSDSSVDFDSDEFEKMIENDDEISSGDESNELEDEEIQQSTEIIHKKSTASSQKKGIAGLHSGTVKKQDKMQSVKRKNIQSGPVIAKKAKFEKQKKTKKPFKKVVVK